MIVDILIFDILKELSIDYCLRKPFNLDYFMEIVKRMFDDKFENSKKQDNKLIKNELNKIFIDIWCAMSFKRI